MMRAFFAIALDPDIKRQLYETGKGLKEQLNLSIKWVRESHLHLTLRFLGNISLLDSEKIAHSLTTIQQLPAFNLEFQQLIAFPSQKPRIIGVGVKINDQLSHLIKYLGEELTRLGFEPEERIFLPHITLGRIAKPRKRGFTLETRSLPQIQPVSQVTLFQSELSPEGSLYSVLHEFPLSSA